MPSWLEHSSPSLSSSSKLIVNSLLDVDFYKLTMGQWILHRFPDANVKFSFKNRTARVKLAETVKEEDLRRELDHVMTLRVNEVEIEYLRGLKGKNGHQLFGEDYLAFLKGLQLPQYYLEYEMDGQIKLEFSGQWSKVTYWETIVLSIVNELHYHSKLAAMSTEELQAVLNEGKHRLIKKIAVLKRNSQVVFSEFGTRRRFKAIWQGAVVEMLRNNLQASQLLGTSNVHLAMKLGLKPIGTMAHELFMVLAALMSENVESIRKSHGLVLKLWREEYGEDLSVALTDTFGTEFFFRDMTREQAEQWEAFRQDSGDPFEFGENAIRFYEQNGIDPREKLIVFSDGLDLETILKLEEHFRGRIKVAFGWGTNLTNDLGLEPLSLVVKATEANGHGTVKLSDNLAKATGKPEDVARYKAIFGHTVENSVECKY